MTIATVPCYDATTGNVRSLPSGQHAGYSTGSGIAWTAAQFAADPHAVQIDQSPVLTAIDERADILDVENGAATAADCVPWAKAAMANWKSAARPGQRYPAIYVNLSNRTAVANALVAGAVTGVGLWLANWNLSQPAAAALVAFGNTGPFPVIGVQYRDAGLYDVSEFSVPWLQAVSGNPPLPPPPPPAGWVYPAPSGVTGAVSRAVTLGWAAVPAPAGEPAPASYSVALYRGTVLSKTIVVTGLTVTIPGLSTGPHSVQVRANGGTGSSPPHATFTFTV